MAGIPERCTRSAPCIFCGDVGYDMRMHYTTEEGYEEVVHWCHKTHATKGETKFVAGKEYICSTADKQIEIGSFDLWKEYLPKDEWLKRHSKDRPARSMSLEVQKGPAKGEEVPLSNKKLHEIYSYMLSLLILEEKHLRLLEEEWSSTLYPSLLKELKGGLVSLPPSDKARFANGEVFKNITRKQLVNRLIARFGTLRGVPGFYLRGGSYYADKPESERWTISGGEGIIFPCRDKDGYIYRLRYREDYPSMELKEGVHPDYNGKFGTFHHYYNKDGKHCFSFTEKQTKETEVVYEPSEGIYKVSLNKKGLVSLGGKPSGKYKTLSSRSIKQVDGRAVNMLEGGCGSGSPYAFYTREDLNYTVILGTEGEKKAMVAAFIKKYPTISVPGVSCFECLFEKDESGISLMDVLKSKGMKYFLLCYDADKTENEMVLKAEQNFIALLKKENIIPLVGEWKGKFNKGLDDILLMGLDINVRPC